MRSEKWEVRSEYVAQFVVNSTLHKNWFLLRFVRVCSNNFANISPSLPYACGAKSLQSVSGGYVNISCIFFLLARPDLCFFSYHHPFPLSLNSRVEKKMLGNLRSSGKWKAQIKMSYLWGFLSNVLITTIALAGLLSRMPRRERGRVCVCVCVCKR